MGVNRFGHGLTLRLTRPGTEGCQKNRVITGRVEPVVIRYLFLSQGLALISYLIFGAWFYIMLTVSSFVISGIHLLLRDGRLYLRFTFPFVKYIGKTTKDKADK